MSRSGLFFLLSFQAFCFSLQSQITGVVVEATEQHEEGELSGYTTYRLYAETTHELDYIMALWGDVEHPLIIESTGTIYHHPSDAGAGWTFSLPGQVEPELASDSWITIGREPNSSGPPYPFLAWGGCGGLNNCSSLMGVGGGLTIDSFEGGGVFVAGPVDCLPLLASSDTCLEDAMNEGHYPFGGTDQRVLVAQITTDGEIRGRLHFRLLAEGQEVPSLETEFFFSSASDVTPGCTDLDASNYNPQATWDDYTCTYPCDHPDFDLSVTGITTDICLEGTGTLSLNVDGAQGMWTVSSNSLITEDCSYGPTTCNDSPSDVNGDQMVTVHDAFIVMERMGELCSAGSCFDLNGDGLSTTADWLIFMGSWAPFPDALDFDGLPAATFDFTVTDAQGCTVSDTAIVAVESPDGLYDCLGQCLNDGDGDGVCDELEIPGCTNWLACNFNPAATEENGTCDLSCSGCMDPAGCNYDPTATIPSVCLFLDVLGNCGGSCEEDSNENGLCDTFETCLMLGQPMWNDVPIGLYFGSDALIWVIGVEILSEMVLNVPLSFEETITGNVYPIVSWNDLEVANLPPGIDATGLPPFVPGASNLCMEFHGTPTSAGSWQTSISGQLSLLVNGGVVSFGTYAVSTTISVSPNPNGSPGCMYPTASNFLPYATSDDGSCLFSGCTDPMAMNYSSAHNQEDGSCEYANDNSDPNPLCPDLDSSGVVGASDLLIFLSSFGTACN